MSKATTTRKVDYFRLPRPLWRKLKKCLPKRETRRAEAAGRVPQTGPLSTASGMCFGRAVSGRLFIGIGSELALASSTSVSRDGGGWASSRS